MERIRIIGDAAWLTFERITTSFCSFVVFLLATRFLSQSDFGIWVYTIAATQIAATSIGIGIEQVFISRYISSANKPEIVRSARIFSLAAVIAAWTISWAVVVAGKTPANELLVLTTTLLLAHLFIPLSTIDELILRSEGHLRQVCLLRILIVTCATALKCVLLWLNKPIETIAIAFVFEAAALALAAHLLLLRHCKSSIPPVGSSEPPNGTKPLWRAVLPSVISAFGVAVFFRMNYFLIERFSTLEQLGLYAFCFTLLQLLLLPPNMVVSAVLPKLASIWGTDKKRFQSTIELIFRVAALASLSIILLVAVIPESLVVELFKGKYVGFSSVMLTMTLSSVPILSGAVRGIVINFMGLTKVHLFSAGVGGAILLLAGLIVVPRYGALGAALALLACSVCSGFLTSYIFPELRPYGRLQLRALLLISRKNGRT